MSSEVPNLHNQGEISAVMFSFHSISCPETQSHKSRLPGWRHWGPEWASRVCRGLQWGHLSAPSQGEPWWLFHDSFPDNTNLLNFSMFSRGRSVPPAPICAYEIDPHFDRKKELHRKRKNEKTRKTVVLSKGKQGRENRELLQHTENGLPIFYMTVIPLENDKSHKTLC